MAAAAASSAPIGDMTKLIGNSLIPGFGFGLMITMAVTVAIAIVGTTLSCMNTAMRVSCGMAEDRELPRSLSFIHDRAQHAAHRAGGPDPRHLRPSRRSACASVVGLTGITLASNFGTFVLYGLTCVWTIVAFKGRKEFSILKHGIVPVLGVLTNVVMLVAILYLGVIGSDDSKTEALICFIIAGAWLLVSLVYVAVTTVQKTYSMKMVSCMIRPEQLQPRGRGAQGRGLHHGHDGDEGERVRPAEGPCGRRSGDGNGGRITFVSKLRVDLVVKDWDVPRVMDIVGEGARTGGNGNVGDGKIFVIDASDAMRIRTGEKGVKAI